MQYLIHQGIQKSGEKEKSDFSKQGNAINVLTPREKTILHLITGGYLSKEIADKLFKSVRTIESHRSYSIQKLNLRSLPDLIRFTVEYSILYRKG
jgi:two-component system, NarL family, response regulator NreC